MNSKKVLVVLLSAAAALGACRSRKPASLPEVPVYVTVGDDAASVLVQTARARQLADVRVVETPGEAQVFWVRDPAEALALGDRLQQGALPPPPDTDARLLDARGRFLPVGAHGRVLLVNPRAALPFEPRNLRDLADPRASGRIAVPAFTSEEGAATMAALTLSARAENMSHFLAALAKNEPIVAASDAEVRKRVASGEAAFGLVGSDEAAAGAASAAGLEVVVPDQAGRGMILLPTAVAVAAGAPRAAAELAMWLAGAEAEEVLVARLPGLMPLRAGVPVPVGVQSTRGVRAMMIDWDRFAEEKNQVRAALEGWPEKWRN